MITAPKDRNAHLPSTWMAAVCLVVLAVGLQGAVSPILPPVQEVDFMDTGENVAMEEFEPPAAGPAETTPQETPEPEKELEEEIPPLPILEAPLTPPEMVELTPLEEAKPPVTPAKREAVKARPVPVNKTAATPNSTGGTGTSAAGGTGPPTLFTGGGSGRFPSPSYPLAARAARQQGTVRLLVVVEGSGMPGSVTVQSSSGIPTLDNAASDHVRRRWRWPAGETRRYIVPVRFVLK